MSLKTCSCGRVVPGLGFASHRAACDVEQARSAAYVAAIEAGRYATAHGEGLLAAAAVLRSREAVV